MTAWTLTGIVTANTTDIITFLATSSFYDQRTAALDFQHIVGHQSQRVKSPARHTASK